MAKVFTVWSEHDIGVENMVFTTKEAAWRTAENIYIQISGETADDFKEYKDAGLVGLTEMELISD